MSAARHMLRTEHVECRYRCTQAGQAGPPRSCCALAVKPQTSSQHQLATIIGRSRCIDTALDSRAVGEQGDRMRAGKAQEKCSNEGNQVTEPRLNGQRQLPRTTPVQKTTSPVSPDHFPPAVLLLRGPYLDAKRKWTPQASSMSK